MSLASSKKALPKLPQTLESDNFEEINISREKGPYNLSTVHEHHNDISNQRFQSNKASSQFLNLGTRITRSTSIGSVNSLKSTKSTKSTRSTKSTSTSNYVVLMEKTPLSLTPSQRLKLRKSQLNESISKLREPLINSVNVKYEEESEDDEIDDTHYSQDIPLTMPIRPINLTEKHIISDGSRFSCFSNSTTTSSIMSYASFNDACSLTSNEADISNNQNHYTNVYQNKENFSSASVNSLSLSKDAFDLSMLFQQTENLKLYEEKRQKLKLLSDFKKIKTGAVTCPPKLFSQKSNSTPNINSLVELHNNQKSMASSNTSLPLTKSKPNLSSSKYYTYTRPVWLPPKSSYDKSKHQRESDNIIHNAILKEATANDLKVKKMEKIKKLRKADVPRWENILFMCRKNPNKDIKTFGKILDMYWRGISDDIRPGVWWKAIGNHLDLDEEFCEKIFNTTRALIRQDQANGSSNSTELRLFSRIEEDLNMASMYLQIGDRKDFLERLKLIVISFVVHLNQKHGNNIGSDVSKLKSYYCKGICNIAGILFHNYKNIYKTFVSLCNIYDSGILNISLELLIATTDKNEGRMNKLKAEFQSKLITPVYELLNQKKNQLYVHFGVIKLDPFSFMHDIALSIFTNLFELDLCSQIFDIFVFEENTVLVKGIFGILTKISHKLYGNKDEVLQILQNKYESSTGAYSIHYLSIGFTYEFIDHVKSIKI